MDVSSLIGIVITLLLTGFFAGIETAFSSANKLSIELKKKQGLGSGRILSKFLESPARLVGTIVIGLSIILVIYTLLMDRFFVPVWKLFPGITHYAYAKLLIESLLTALLFLIFEFLFRS